METYSRFFSEYERLSSISGLTLYADKTEIFKFTQSQFTSNRVVYRGANYDLSRVGKITICGMCMATDSGVEYHQNASKRIDTMELIVASWGRRNLTINGRMLLAKTFLLSQIVFPAQFYQIGNREVKMIERLIYSFVNGARHLYGPEQIARKYLKADKENGGINGADVSCFVAAIAIRQFGKALRMCRALRALQVLSIAPRDHICDIALKQIKSSRMAVIKTNPIPDLQQLEAIPSTSLNAGADGTHLTRQSANQYIERIINFVKSVSEKSGIGPVEFEGVETAVGSWAEDFPTGADPDAVLQLRPLLAATRPEPSSYPGKADPDGSRFNAGYELHSSPPPPPGFLATQGSNAWRTPEVNSSLALIERRLGRLEAKTFYDNVMMAGLQQEQDTEANRSMLDRVTISGIPAWPTGA